MRRPFLASHVRRCGVAAALGGATALFACGGETGATASGGDASTDGAVADGVSNDVSNVVCAANGAPVTLTTGPEGAGQLVVDATNAYWINSIGSAGPVSPGPQDEVLQCSKCGCDAPTVLAAGQAPQGLAVDATSVYWTNNGNVMKVPIGGGAAITLAVADAGSIVVDATSVYFASGTTISKVPVGGGNPTTLVTGVISGGVMAVDATNLYWTDTGAGTVQKVPVGGGSPTSLALGQSPSAIAVDATNVYWTNFDDGSPGATVMMVPIAGGNLTTLASGLQSPYGIAVDEMNVYWTSNNAVLSVPKGGGSTTTLLPSDAYLAPMGIAVDATSVYWTDSINGALAKLTPK